MKLQNHIPTKQGSPQQPISRTFQMVALSLSLQISWCWLPSLEISSMQALSALPAFAPTATGSAPRGKQQQKNSLPYQSLFPPLRFPPSRLHSWHPDTHQAPKRFLLSLLLRLARLADQQQVTAVPGTPPQPSVETSGSPALEEPPNFYPGTGSGTIMEPT